MRKARCRCEVGGGKRDVQWDAGAVMEGSSVEVWGEYAGLDGKVGRGGRELYRLRPSGGPRAFAFRHQVHPIFYCLCLRYWFLLLQLRVDL